MMFACECLGRGLHNISFVVSMAECLISGSILLTSDQKACLAAPDSTSITSSQTHRPEMEIHHLNSIPLGQINWKNQWRSKRRGWGGES